MKSGYLTGTNLIADSSPSGFPESLILNGLTVKSLYNSLESGKTSASTLMTAKHKAFKRWYERQPQLALSVRVLTLLPDEVCSVLGEGLLKLMQDEGHETFMEKRYRSLGTEKVLGLHKSKNRRREYDKTEILHKAMNNLYLLSDESQDFIAAHILLMASFIQRYMANYLGYKPGGTLEELGEMAQRFMSEQSPEEVATFLKKLREEFFSLVFGGAGNRNQPSLSTSLAPNAKPSNTRITTKDNTQGMKIKELELD